MPSSLILTVEEYCDLSGWRWTLRVDDGASGGKMLGSHEARLDRSDSRFAGWIDLPAYLHHHAAPDRRGSDEPRLLREFGDWLTEKALGGLAPILADYAPATLRIILPDNARDLALRPLEAARINGKTLLRLGVTPVHVISGAKEKPNAAPVGESLRVLAAFSLPPRHSPLNLRQERQALRKLVKDLQGVRKANIELRTLQYGATRELLAEALEDGDGWDVAHFSGHGAPGELVLEGEGGAEDCICADDLAEILRHHRARLKLVVLSACHSGAAAIDEQLAGLDIHPENAAAEDTGARDAASRAGSGGDASSLAQKLVESLDCAVLAMRFSVGDRFAIDMAGGLYRQMWEKKAPLPPALARAVGDACKAGAGDLAAATPALFGNRAADLTLVPPGGFTPPPAGPFACLPHEAAVFVGRVATMTRAAAALARDGGQAGVLFHGMAGAGKTACAAELAHHMRAAGRFTNAVWWKAPDMGAETAGALADFANAFDLQLGEAGFTLAAAVGDDKALRAKLPVLRQFLADRSYLIVLDNIESLLSAGGQWLDRQFGEVISALCGHGGLSRVVLTGRAKPADAPAGLIVEAVHALSLREAMLVLDALPQGRALLHGDTDQRRMARRMLQLTQGHPKLLELALAAAADPAALTAQLDAAEQTWRDAGQPLAAFFAAGESRVDDQGFLNQLSNWTQAALAPLPAAARTLFFTLCAMEEEDREEWLIRTLWPHVWGDVAGGAAPDPADLLAALTAAALLEREEEAAEEEKRVSYRLHPGVAEAGLKHAPNGLRTTVDTYMGGIWRAVLQMGLENEAEGGGAMIRRAGLAAAPYLLRQGQWEAAGSMLEEVLFRDKSPATAAAALPLLRAAADNAVGPDALTARGRLGLALRMAGRIAAAESELRAVIDQAVAVGRFHTVAVAAGDLLNLLLRAGRLAEALTLAEQIPDYTARAGFGPWTRLLDETQRLQILAYMGRYAEVLSAVQQCRETMRDLPETSDAAEAVNPWNVREILLDAGREAASRAEDWRAALDFNREILASRTARNAPPSEMAATCFNDYGPLLRLQRFEEAAALLADCRRVFEAEQHWGYVGKVLSAQGDLANARGRPAEAAKLQQSALRLGYAAAPEDCAISHANLAIYLLKAGAPPAAALAHQAAAILLGALTDSGAVQDRHYNLVLDLRDLGADTRAALPADLAAVIETVEQVEGVRFSAMIKALNRDGQDLDALLQEIFAAALKAAEGGE
jgi:tetratricopeptide (TPR) repeat protein